MAHFILGILWCIFAVEYANKGNSWEAMGSGFMCGVSMVFALHSYYDFIDERR